MVKRPVTYFPSSARGLMLVSGSSAYVCTKSYIAKAPGELSLKRGEIVEGYGMLQISQHAHFYIQLCLKHELIEIDVMKNQERILSYILHCTFFQL